jgi:hypothetical protein
MQNRKGFSNRSNTTKFTQNAFQYNRGPISHNKPMIPQADSQITRYSTQKEPPHLTESEEKSTLTFGTIKVEKVCIIERDEEDKTIICINSITGDRPYCYYSTEELRFIDYYNNSHNFIDLKKIMEENSKEYAQRGVGMAYRNNNQMVEDSRDPFNRSKTTYG